MTKTPAMKPRKGRSTPGQPAYTGALAKPIATPAPRGWVLTAEQWEKQREEAYLKAFEEKLPLLFSHFGIAPGDWKSLSLALAQAHVLGLQPSTPEQRGPKRFWSLPVMQAFMEQMQTEIDGPQQRSVANAAAILAKRREWKDRLKAHEKPTEVLRRKYFELKQVERPPEEIKKLVKQLQRQK